MMTRAANDNLRSSEVEENLYELLHCQFANIYIWKFDQIGFMVDDKTMNFILVFACNNE